MRVITKKRLREFWGKWPEAEAPLKAWHTITEDADWKTPADVKQSANSVDFVGDCAVFNIGGNKFRLVVLIHYEAHKVYTLHVLTHREYDKGRWKSDCNC